MQRQNPTTDPLTSNHMVRQPGQEKLWLIPFFEAGIAVSLLALALFVALALAGRAQAQD